MKWVYEQNTGKLFSPAGTLMATGYAGGDGGKRSEGVNNHDMQSVHNVGPLPVGMYVLGVAVEGSHLGPLAIPLIPDPGNEMFSRGSFFVHGDRADSFQSASDGCVIMPRLVREQIVASEDRVLEVKLSEA